ncbi:MAG: SIS domain-containing protein [Thaumarchaeota archaeon]|nr:SIS domain-containing protein [Nitrososphaerota archaeon]
MVNPDASICNFPYLVKTYDSQGMFKNYTKWYNIALEVFNKKIKDLEQFQKLVFLGMGGSSHVGLVVTESLYNNKIVTKVNNSYILSPLVDEDTLVIATSVSGDTDETIRAMMDANNRKAKIIAFSSGGKMQRMALDNGMDYVKIGSYGTPRESLPAYVFAIIAQIATIDRNLYQDAGMAIEHLKELSTTLLSEQIDSSPSEMFEKNILNIATRISKSDLPLILCSPIQMSVGTRFKSALNENAKMDVVFNDVFEASHNTVVPFVKPFNRIVILLSNQFDDQYTQKRFEAIKQLLDNQKIEFLEIYSRGRNKFESIISTIFIADLISMTIAILHGIDPTPITCVDYLKKHTK